MTITAPNGNAESVRVLHKRHRYFIFMPGEKRLVLTRAQARDLHTAVDLAEELFQSWIGERFDRMIEGESVTHEPDPTYEIPFLQHAPNSDDLGMLRAWLKDALYGWGDPYFRAVKITKESRAAAERLGELIDGDLSAIEVA